MPVKVTLTGEPAADSQCEAGSPVWDSDRKQTSRQVYRCAAAHRSCWCYLRPELSAGPLRLVQLRLELPQQLPLHHQLLLQAGVLRLQLSQSFLRVGRLHLHRVGHILRSETHDSR